MSFTSWRGVVGCIKPTLRPGGLEELIRMLPEGIGVLPLFLNIHEGTTDEFKRAVTPYEPLVKQLADAGCDLIHPEGAPPFMLLGFKGEADHLKKWEKQYKVPFFTSGSNHVRALRALKAKKIVGATYFVGPINDMFAGYFKQAGFDVLGMEGIKVEFDKVQNLSAEQVYAFVKQTFLKHRKADAIYLLPDVRIDIRWGCAPPEYAASAGLHAWPLPERDMKNDHCTCSVEISPDEVDAGADITLKVRVRKPAQGRVARSERFDSRSRRDGAGTGRTQAVGR